MDETITAMKARIEQLEAEQDRLRQDMSRAQLDDWEGRLDDVGLQIHLGAMEFSDRLEPVIETARGQIAEARSRIDDGSETASEAAAAIRSGLEQAWSDIRSAIGDARAIVRP